MPESYQDTNQLQSLIRSIIREEIFGLLDGSEEAPEPKFSFELEKRLDQCRAWLNRDAGKDLTLLSIDEWTETKILRTSGKLSHLAKDRPIGIQSKSLRKAISAAFYLSDQNFINLTILP